MGRPKDSTRRDAIIREYERHLTIYGYAKYDEITRAVGLFANHSSYVRRVIQLYRASKSAGAMSTCPRCRISHHRPNSGKWRYCVACETTIATFPDEYVDREYYQASPSATPGGIYDPDRA
jgi:hypothetical protein